MDSIQRSVYFDELKKSCPSAADRYLEKIREINIDPYTLTETDLDFALDSVPPIASIDIISYVVLTHSYYTTEQMKAYKSLAAYKYFEAGFVDRVGVKQINDYVVLVGKVQHSMKARDSKLKVWIIAKKNGGICTAHCTCMAGLGEVCSHIAAILYAAEHATNIKNTISCTDVKSVWPVPSQSGLQPTPVASMDWGKKIESTAKYEVSEMTEQEIVNMLKDIENAKLQSSLMRIVEPFASKIMAAQNAELPLIYFNLYDRKNENKNLQDLIMIGKSIDTEIPLEIFSKIEQNTRDQHNSVEWYRQRTGRVTASVFKRVCSSPVDKPSISLIKSICYPTKVHFSSKATTWGKKHEDIAADAYYAQMKSDHEDFLVNKVGLIVSKKWPQLAATPDRLVFCECCLGGCLEVKCPYNLRSDVTLDEYALTKGTCLITFDDKTIHLDQKHSYFYQVQAQIFICNLLYCDFVVWSPNFLFVERIYPDFKFWEENVEKALLFHKNVILPELLGRYYTSKIPGGNISKWCICESVDDGSPMIRCSNKNCQIINFHLKCVSVPTLEPSWLCPSCNLLLSHDYI